MITPNTQNEIQKQIEDHLNVSSLQWKSIAGGSINQSYRLTSGDRSFFVKINKADEFPEMFEAEARGLEMLKEHSSFYIPEILATGKIDNDAYLVMEWLEKGVPGNDFWEDFAGSLAEMHRHSADQFGLNHNNYIGSLPQQNDHSDSWAAFYVTKRLEPQLRLVIDKGLAGITVVRAFERLFNRLEDLFPKEEPALIHGDLWSGNYLCHVTGKATIFDPAVYYGHREMDLAMTKLFGGFDSDFYEHYHRIFPLENDWRDRVALAQLYPLLVHVNLFGAGYLAQVKSCLKAFA